jgi:hypothetical protein
MCCLRLRLASVAFATIFLAASAWPATNVIIPAGSQWKYLDDGSDQGASWRAPMFDDRSWSNGLAQFGYSTPTPEGDEVTTIRYGTNAADKHLTYYFRKGFSVAAGSNYTQVTLRVLRDDGAVVYLNGTNVFRSNMPTGPIDYRTRASSNVGSPEESTFYSTNLPGTVLLPGTNVLAVEVHQFSTNSADLSFDLQLLGVTVPPSTNGIPSVTRGPYLQQGTPNSLLVRWRTDVASNSRVWFGTNSTELTRDAVDAAVTNEHIVLLAGLLPDTKYFYSIGFSNRAVAGDATYHFVTPPTNAKPTRIWVIGDSGTADERPRSVYQAYTNYAGARYTDLWLMLGDNAYNTGTDSQYQEAVFEMYPELLRQSVLWPTLGNHDTAFSSNPSPSIPYFRIFSLPVNAESGGVPSGTEKYYSFNYGNIHFVCLDAMASDRSADGAMCTWLQEDLAANEQEWLIAYWHHPPYTKGSHDSDLEVELIEMRENAVPILEAFGVDLVLNGHSHCYERSFLITGHYGLSATFDDTMKKDGGSGRPDGTGAYVKPTSGSQVNEGTVYIVAGSSGQATFGDLDHPIMYFDELELGSLILDVDGPVLEAKFLRETGVIDDYFTIVKGSVPEVLPVLSYQIVDNMLILTWNTHPGRRYVVERASRLGPDDFRAASEEFAAVGSTLSWSTPLLDVPQSFYRIVRSPGN